MFISAISQEQLIALVKNSFKEATEEVINKINGEAMLTQDEAAIFFKVSKPTIISWGAKGLIHPHELGGRVFYLKSELLKAGQKGIQK